MGVYVITGANRGIGLEFVNQLSSDPSNTVIASTRSLLSDLSALKSLNKQHNNIHVLECDTSSFPSIHTFSLAVSKIIGSDGKIDYLLNSAAIQDIKDDSSLQLTEHNLLSHIQTNVLGPAEMVKSLLKHLQKGSVVMNMTSGIGSMSFSKRSGVPTMHTTYSISKAALDMLTVHQDCDLEKGGRGVIVVCMDPGWVKTRMGGEGAIMEREDSVNGMLKCLRGLKEEDSGRFWNSSGEEVPW